MDITRYKPTTFIVPTQHVMERAYTVLINKYIPFDSFILIYMKFHRDVLNQSGSLITLDIFDEFEDDLCQLIIKFSKDRPFVELLESSDCRELALGWDTIRGIGRELFNKLKEAELLLGGPLSASLPESFYNYHCEPIWVRIYAGDLVVHLRPSLSLGVING